MINKKALLSLIEIEQDNMTLGDDPVSNAIKWAVDEGYEGIKSDTTRLDTIITNLEYLQDQINAAQCVVEEQISADAPEGE